MNGDVKPKKEIPLLAVFVDKCVICSEAISENTPFLATSGCAFAQEHSLFPYCDTGLHQRCLLHWPHRREFSTAYFEQDETYRIYQNDEWWLGTGPFVSLPQGKVDFPYYIAVRFRDWPIRLYSRFADWPEYTAQKVWQPKCISELNDYVDEWITTIPADTDSILNLLIPPVLGMIQDKSNHKTRLFGIRVLERFGFDRIEKAIDAIRDATHDSHVAIQQAARALLNKHMG